MAETSTNCKRKLLSTKVVFSLFCFLQPSGILPASLTMTACALSPTRTRSVIGRERQPIRGREFSYFQNVVLMCFSIDQYVSLDNVQNKWWEEIRSGSYIMIKGQSDHIFDQLFFHQSNPPGPLTYGLKHFRFWLVKFRQVIRI